uniref:APOPT family protein CBG23705, mitochondrial n=1 Tax=Aceria tosichella TaxID=561515 RepID=A0A6G1SHC2_9ACAR
MFKLIKFIRTISERRNVSKPQILSRLRYVNIIKRPDEIEQERVYRERYNELQDWNEKYWAENNEIFNREKEKYIKENFGTSTNDQALSHDQLAPFYREFLDKNRGRHVLYNKTWYKQIITLLSDSLKAKAARLTKYRDR